jgi:hypothetical protein
MSFDGPVAPFALGRPDNGPTHGRLAAEPLFGEGNGNTAFDTGSGADPQPGRDAVCLSIIRPCRGGQPRKNRQTLSGVGFGEKIFWPGIGPCVTVAGR